jgi:GNAT superfamily N-acetyltransferase
VVRTWGGGLLHVLHLRLPPYRGRRVQYQLDEERLRWARRRGFRWVYAIVESSNRASRRGLARSGFEATARLDEVRVGGWSVLIVRRLSGKLPAGMLRPGGLAAGSWHVIPDHVE